MWKSESLGLLKWSEALQAADSLDFAGHDEWRLPNVHEALTLHSTQPYVDAPGTLEFSETWTSTTWNESTDAYIVGWGNMNAFVYKGNKTINTVGTWAVRGPVD